MINNCIVTKDIKDSFREQMRVVFDSIKDNLEFGNVHNSDDYPDLFDELWQNSNLARLMMYFLYNEVVGVDVRIDCDVSYEVLIGHISNYNVLLNGGKHLVVERQVRAGTEMLYKYKVIIGEKDYYGDTLTSIWNPIRLWISDPKVYEKHYPPEERLLTFDEKKGRYCVPNDNQQRIKSRYGLSVKNKVVWAIYILENLQHFEALLKESMQKVISMYHTRNNFLLVPEFFNTGAAGKYACNDYADLKLSAIYDYFQTRNTISLEEMFSDIEEYVYVAGKRVEDPRKTIMKKEEILSATLTWLDEYSDWESFVESNRLSNYIDIAGRPIELWKNHERGQIPNVAQLEQLFDNMEKILVKTNDETGCIH